MAMGSESLVQVGAMKTRRHSPRGLFHRDGEVLPDPLADPHLDLPPALRREGAGAPDGPHRRRLAAGRSPDGALHRHGDGAADLLDPEALQRRGLRRLAGGDLDGARARAGDLVAAHRRPLRLGDGSGARHDAGHRADRCARGAGDRSGALPGRAAGLGDGAHAAAADRRRRRDRHRRRLPGLGGLLRRQSGDLHGEHLHLHGCRRRLLRPRSRQRSSD